MCRPQSSRHIPCAVHLESWQKLDCERHGGACLHLLPAVSQNEGTQEDRFSFSLGQKITTGLKPSKAIGAPQGHECLSNFAGDRAQIERLLGDEFRSVVQIKSDSNAP